MKKNAIYEVTREVHTFVDLNHGADILIKNAEFQPEGSFYTTMSALLLTAFTFEAYLNHLNYLLDENCKLWEEEETVKVLDKYTAICKNLDFTPDKSRRPYQTLINLFRFRNSIAHGKSKRLEISKDVHIDENPSRHDPKETWEKYCSLQNAKNAYKDIQQIIVELHQKAGHGNRPFIHGDQFGSLTLKESR
uniref:RiboL-PSP-HEPN domain-containing protein n=1 Tax=Candidatus Nitrotoga fabula TaxID=2182327 RepID=A0A2X0QU58_9PROT|nr:conserved protein of unknown function [Candidatus Nitrotoga fabula]